jgi:hypothetical protein
MARTRRLQASPPEDNLPRRPLNDAEVALVLLGQWVEVVSSNVAAVQYDAGGENLFIRYQGKNGKPDSEYQYLGVSPESAEDLCRSYSKGQWIDRNLKKRGVPYIRMS